MALFAYTIAKLLVIGPVSCVLMVNHYSEISVDVFAHGNIPDKESLG